MWLIWESACLARMEPCAGFIAPHIPDMAAHACNPSTWEGEAGELRNSVTVRNAASSRLAWDEGKKKMRTTRLVAVSIIFLFSFSNSCSPS